MRNLNLANLWIKPSAALLSAVLLFMVPFNSYSGAVSAKGTIADPLAPQFPWSLASKTGKFNVLKEAGNTAIAAVDPGINTASSDPINVIIQFSEQPVSVARYASELGKSSFKADSAERAIRTEQSAFVASARGKGINMSVNYKYETVLNGMEVTVNGDQIPKLALMNGVKAISPNRTYYPIPLPASPVSGDAASSAVNYDINPIAQIGADAAWSQGLTGKGLKVGVIDTGIDYDHPNLQGRIQGRRTTPSIRITIPDEGCTGYQLRICRL